MTAHTDGGAQEWEMHYTESKLCTWPSHLEISVDLVGDDKMKM